MSRVPEQALVLVDFNNVEPRKGSDSLLQEALELVGALVRRLTGPTGARRPRDAYDVDVRLYDGWLDRTGERLEKCRRTTGLVDSALSGISEGVRIHAQVVTSLACRPDAHLRGTYINGAQKMVDQMLAQDLHYFASLREYDRIGLIANDDDYVPAVIASACRYDASITWLRARDRSRNDDYLSAVRVATMFDPVWSR